MSCSTGASLDWLFQFNLRLNLIPEDLDSHLSVPEPQTSEDFKMQELGASIRRIYVAGTIAKYE